MRAITVRQPWAWAIEAGHKTVENRTRGTNYRGPLAIHAGLGWSERGAADPRVKAHKGATWVFGAIIALAELEDSHPDTGCCRPWGESQYTEAGGRTRTVLHHLILHDIRPFKTPVPCRGALGLWTPGPDLLQALTREQTA